MDDTWTIWELCSLVAEELVATSDVPSGKARAIPDERSIRYYTTLGLIDRPTLHGRTAFYGPRHLAQLIAIKKMQAHGASLAEIQELLPAIEDEPLSKLTGIQVPPRARPPARRDFWRTAPAAATTELAADTAAPPPPSAPTALAATTELAADTAAPPPPSAPTAVAATAALAATAEL
ncbi:MAG TPA: MerR family transcriptional regulator, partial [Kofleriaceae bacterium]|nr:MerR family transcriptional regulator [Kofleriaceae bacterium]